MNNNHGGYLFVKPINKDVMKEIITRLHDAYIVPIFATH